MSMCVFMSFRRKGLLLSTFMSETCIRVQFNDVVLWIWVNMHLPISLILFISKDEIAAPSKLKEKIFSV